MDTGFIQVESATIYLITINFITILLYGIDKYKARRDQWRIKERTLLLCAVLGGSPGALLAMWLFHHKTKKPKFYIGVPLILILQIALILTAVYALHYVPSLQETI